MYLILDFPRDAQEINGVQSEIDNQVFGHTVQMGQEEGAKDHTDPQRWMKFEGLQDVPIGTQEIMLCSRLKPV